MSETADAASPPPAFAPRVGYGIEVDPRDVAVGDLDGDTYPDIVAVGTGIDEVGTQTDRVLVGFGDGDGPHAPEVSLGAGSVPTSVAVGDLDGDGDRDLVVTNAGRFINSGTNHDASVSVLLNNGDGTFAPDTEILTPFGPVAVAIEDVNSDTDPDLVVTHAGVPLFSSGGMSVRLGNGDGTFVLASEWLFPGDLLTPEVEPAVAEVTGDSHPDIVLPGSAAFPSLRVLVGNGDGTFDPPVAVVDPLGVASTVAIGDLDGDGANEVVVSYDVHLAPSNHVAVLTLEPDGTIGEKAVFPLVTAGPTDSLALGDLNDDGHLDVAAVSAVSAGVHLGNGDGTFDASFGATLPLPSFRGHTSMALADLDGDDRLDIATGHQETYVVSVLINETVPVVPDAPTVGSAAAGNGRATVSWTVPVADGGSAVTGYVVTPYVGYYALPPRSFGSTATTQVVTGLTNGTTYRFRVQAVNAVGTGPLSTVTNPVRPAAATAPGAPTIGTAVAGSGSATVTWTTPASDGGSPVTGYVVTPYVGYWAGMPRVFSSTATSQTVTGLTNGWGYRFRVQAINAVGTGPYSTVTNPVTPTV